MNYLIDTCIVSDFFKKVPTVVEGFRKTSPRQIHLSSITVMEVEFGLNLNAERAKKIRPLWDQLLKHVQVIPFSSACAIAAAAVRSQLKQEGLPIGPYDTLIAGTAIANGLVVVTANLREFQRVSSLKTENWR